MVRSQDSTGSLKLRLVHAQLKWWPLIAIHETRKFFFCSAFWLCWQLFLIRRPQSRIITAFTWPDQVIVKWLSTSNVALSHRYVCTQPWQGGIWLILGVNSSVLEFAKVPCERLVQLPHPQSLDYSRVGNHVCVIYVVFFLSDPSPIIGYACQWLPNWLTDCRLVNLIDVTLACEDTNSKLVDIVTVTNVDDEKQFTP